MALKIFFAVTQPSSSSSAFTEVLPGLSMPELCHIGSGGDWVHAFADGYNMVHRHCGIQYVTPQQRHSGEDVAILRGRHEVYEAAQRQHPTR